MVTTTDLVATSRLVMVSVASVTPLDVTAVADLSGVTNASGTYTVPATIRVANDLDVGTVQSHLLTVRIGLPEEETDTELETEESP